MIEKLIAKLRSYDRVSEAECEALVSAFSAPVTLPRGQVFIRAGQEAHSSAIVVSGFAHRIKDLADGRRQSIEIYVPGDFVDLDGYVLRRSDHDIRCLSRCRVASVSHTRLHEVTAKFPDLGRLLWLNTTLDGALHRERIMSLGTRTAVERLAHLVCETAMRLNVVGLGDERGFDSPLTQNDLAELLGLSMVHTNRTVRELRERGLAKISHNRVEITAWPQLKKIAGFDNKYLSSLETDPVGIRLSSETGDTRIGDERRQDQARSSGRIPDIAERGLRSRLLDVDTSGYARGA